MKLLKSTVTVGGSTILSRILGFVRDVVLAKMFGASGETDAFFLAFKIPNFMRRLFAEGSFSLAFVPVLSEYRATGDRKALRDLIDHVTGTLAAILLVISSIGIIAAPLVGGTLFSVFVTGITLFSYNYAIYNFVKATMPLSLESSVNNLVEWNIVVLLCSSFTMFFDRYLNRQLKESMRVNQALKIQKQNSLHNARLASLGEMAGGIAHEINNPLTIIDGNASLLREMCVDSKPALSRIDRITETVSRIQTIIEAMKKLSHSEESGQDHSSENISDVIKNASVFYQEKINLIFKMRGRRSRQFLEPAL